jgi:serine phosphatase RsbU (regulator of sigma subunit)
MQATTSRQVIKYTAFLGAFWGWCLLVGYETLEIYYWTNGQSEKGLPFFIKGLFLNLFILCVWLFTHKSDTQQAHDEDFYGRIHKTFAITTFCGIFSLILRGMLWMTSRFWLEHIFLYNVLYHLDLALFSIFLITMFFKWRHMILYKSNRLNRRIWRGFYTLLLASTVMHLARPQQVPPLLSLLILVAVIVGFLPLVVNLKWIAILSYQHKVNSLAYLGITLLIQSYFVYEILSYQQIGTDRIEEVSTLITNLERSVFFIGLYLFTALYGLSAFFAILFNLPTASVFEKKMGELDKVQQLSAAISGGDSEQQIYRLLLNSAQQILGTDAAWIEVEEQGDKLILHNISYEKALRYQRGLQLKHLNSQEDPFKVRKYQAKQLFETPTTQIEYHSLLSIPLENQRQKLGTLVLLKKQENAFDGLALATLHPFVSQASVTLHNFKLLAEAVKVQQYKNELELARKVKSRLLPKRLQQNDDFDIFILTGSSSEVGGDYYDFYQVSPTRYVVIIADVAGHGTSVAFYVAQVKGVFQSLVQMDLAPDLFMEYANSALANCLERSIFVSATYLVIDTEKKTIYQARAGHCPTIFYKNSHCETEVWEGKGLGLNLLKNNLYRQHIETTTHAFEEEDVLLLYTDGITEARNPVSGEEYGVERLRQALTDSIHCLALQQIAETILADVNDFIDDVEFRDDYTLLLIRFF